MHVLDPFSQIQLHICMRKIMFHYLAPALAVVRLVNGGTGYEGRVEVYHNGVWGTVCDNGWDLSDAEVVCKELGLGPAIDAKSEAFYGQGGGLIWLANVSCTGEEAAIRECSYNGWGIGYCEHSEDAGVKCAASNGIYIVKIYVCAYAYIRICTL